MSFQIILIHSEYKKVPCSRKFGNKFFSIGTTLDCRSLGDPLLNFEGDPEVRLLNFEGDPGILL